MQVLPAGRRAVLLETDEPPADVAAAVHALGAAQGIGLVDVVPGAATVLVGCATPGDLDRLVAALPGLRVVPSAEAAGEVVEIPVRYDGQDLGAVAAATGLSVAEVVLRHAAATYRAVFTGFAPGFAYLAGLDPALHLPRLATPRPAVPAGAVALADAWTAVYPRRSPGGWHLIGSTGATMFDLSRTPAALVAPGRRVRFVPT